MHKVFFLCFSCSFWLLGSPNTGKTDWSNYGRRWNWMQGEMGARNLEGQSRWQTDGGRRAKEGRRKGSTESESIILFLWRVTEHRTVRSMPVYVCLLSGRAAGCSRLHLLLASPRYFTDTYMLTQHSYHTHKHIHWSIHLQIVRIFKFTVKSCSAQSSGTDKHSFVHNRININAMQGIFGIHSLP